MAIVDYSPPPPGSPGYVFHDDSGKSAYLFGPEAEGLKSWIDQSKPPDARTAYDPSAPFGSVAAVPDAPPAPVASVPDVPPNMSPAPAMSMAPPTPALAMSVPAAAVPPPMAPRPVPAVPVSSAIAPPGPVESLPMLGGGEGGAPMTRDEAIRQTYNAAVINAATRGSYVPGAAAVDPERMMREGRPVEVGEAVVGAQPETQEEHDRRIAYENSQHEADATALTELDAANAERIAEAKRQQVDAAHRAAELSGDLYDAQKRDAQANAIFQTNVARLQKEQDAVTQMKVDPNRLFREKGALASIGSALAVGLGAFGSALAKTPNYANEIVQGAINRDIAAQEDEIQRKGANANNAMANFVKTYGLTLDESRELAKSTQLRYAASMVDMNAAKMTSIDAKAKAAAMKADFLAQAQQRDASLSQMLKGRITKQFAFVQPRAATRGYYKEPTLKDLHEGAMAVGAVNKAFAPAGGGKLSARLGAQEATNESAIEDLQNFKKNAPEGYVLPDTTGIPRTDARIQLDAAAKAIVGKVVAGSNGAYSQDEAHNLERQLADPRESVRNAAAARLHEALRTSHSAIERQRGNNQAALEINAGGGEE